MDSPLNLVSVSSIFFSLLVVFHDIEMITNNSLQLCRLTQWWCHSDSPHFRTGVYLSQHITVAIPSNSNGYMYIALYMAVGTSIPCKACPCVNWRTLEPIVLQRKPCICVQINNKMFVSSARFFKFTLKHVSYKVEWSNKTNVKS